ncbi:hypothetical protein DJ030_07140 [bacterium endosymbiont of Escarpia laminata]|nr:MAG: hypothetical protein DJ030_07140 [bacterium endosymbiont of Escarpia laminata]
MNSLKTLIVAVASVLICNPVLADERVLKQRISDLENRVTALEQLMEETGSKDRWKDLILWQRIKKEMSSDDTRKLLGKPGRVEEQIFTTWYYHPTSKLHSYVWFDEGKVLGWEAPNE